ncbi:methyltransferase family protein [Psychroflexus aestuariivivens]|uniref:methyltransferase family protein n=1 Tax=Psychroflexus aestuariivivens TaxID=1795040 RepID=UPI000FDC8E1A|nr:isoprenylcysteine carboxylmethyltransferase family protein [Psychroflexus aestuariivivens]
MKSTSYLIQAALVSLWWVGLYTSQDFFMAFQFPNIPKVAFNSFFIPDLVLIMGLSLFRAYKKSKTLEWIILGAFAYGSLYCLNASILTGGGFLSTTIMMLGLGYNLFLVNQSQLFRQSRSQNQLINGLKTVFQIICFWSISLVLFPWIIIDGFDLLPTNKISFEISSYVLFVVSSVLGLSSAFAMVKYGDGTPLPTDQTNQLVTNGIYKYVRNPMAIAGMGQGIAISIYFESFHILIYTILGGLLWHVVVRPIEEKNMLKRFGKAYKDYTKTVGLWFPRSILRRK